MFLIERNVELDNVKLGKLIQQFQTKELPRLINYYNYYKGKQNILSKQATDVGKPCNKVVCNYCSGIVDTYNGYITGIDINYSSDSNIDEIIDVLNYNDVHSEDNQLLRDALIYGRAVELNYIDEDAKQRFKVIDPRSCFAVYDDTINQNLVYAIRFYAADYINEASDSYYVEVYDKWEIKKYKSTMGFTSFELIEQYPHFFNQVPLTFFDLNKEQDSVFDRVMSLQDAYNKLLSAEVDDFESFADAYLILKGCYADDDQLTKMKEARALALDADADASYLTKSINDTQIQNMLKNINDQIHTIALSPDFNDEKFMAQSGIAMRYKLVGFENQASAIESQMRKALQKRIELIASILSLTSAETMWRDINIQFTRNLPENLVETAQVVNSLRGLVSDETLLSLLPFINDPSAELKKTQDEKAANIDLYSFDTSTSGEEEEVKDDESKE